MSPTEPPQASDARPDTPASFEAALTELETLVQQMEAGSLTLEEALLAYRRGTRLVTQCRETLAVVQQQVKVLEGDLLKPFEAEPRAEG